MTNKLLTASDLLGLDGLPQSFGYAHKPIINNNYENIRRKFRYKEWDFYQISNPNWTLQLTFGHISYAGALNAVLFNYKGERYEATLPLVLPMEGLRLPKSADAACTLSKSTSNFRMTVEVAKVSRRITVQAKTKSGQCDIDITLTYPDAAEGILVVTPFSKPYEYYHNYKQCCMAADGYAAFGGKKVLFSKTDSFGLIDWGRGILPFRHTWWWGNGSTVIDGNYLGFNIGVFGDTSFATENTLFYNHKAHKLGQITYKRGDYLQPWLFTSDDKRFEMTFTPIFDNHTKIKLLWVNNSCHQVFGSFSGTAVLDDGSIITVQNMLAFVEEANNRW